MMTPHELRLYLKDRVIKEGGDYRFEGEIVSIFKKKSGVWRYVVENDDGMLMIMNATQLKRKPDGASQA